MLNNRKNSQIKKILCGLFTLTTLMFVNLGTAAPPLPYTAYYDAYYQGLKAQAEISLTQLGDTDFVANSSIILRLFGTTFSTIKEISQFDWHNDAPRSHHYEYKQSGIGGRSHSIDFDWQNNLALASLKDKNVEILLESNALDELSMYSLIRAELQKGNNDITFTVLDRDMLEEYHYHAIGEEEVQTKSGIFTAIKVERLRKNSNRLTHLWFAKNNDMLLIKLYQLDPDGDEFEITLNEAQINGETVRP